MMEIEQADESQEEHDCILSDEPLLNDIKKVSDKCCEISKSLCVKRKDSLHARFSRNNDLQLHNKCYVSYTHAGNIVAAAKKVIQLSPKKRRSAGEFAFSDLRFFCNSEASGSFVLSQSKENRK